MAKSPIWTILDGGRSVLSMEWGALLPRDYWLAESPEAWVPTPQVGVWVTKALIPTICETIPSPL